MGLFEIRSSLALSQRHVAVAAKVSQSMVAKTETGAANPTLNILRSIADAVCCSIEDLVGPVSDQRLKDIKAAYLQREADRAREEAGRAS